MPAIFISTFRSRKRQLKSEVRDQEKKKAPSVLLRRRCFGWLCRDCWRQANPELTDLFSQGSTCQRDFEVKVLLSGVVRRQDNPVLSNGHLRCFLSTLQIIHECMWWARKKEIYVVRSSWVSAGLWALCTAILAHAGGCQTK
jgi:hypothetical protein